MAGQNKQIRSKPEKKPFTQQGLYLLKGCL